MNKQDMNGVRTAQDLERKYKLSSIGELKQNYEFQKETLTKVENENNNILKSIIINLDGILESQSDISLWFFSGTPTLENSPYTDWENYEEHIGDIYYDKETGEAFIFKKRNNEYLWEKSDSTELIRAMALSNAEVTLGNERKVFFDPPIPPYQNGDWYVKDNELYICQITREETEKYSENDFIIAVKYTDDTYAIGVGESLKIVSGTVTEIRDDVDELTKTMTNTTKLVDEQGNTIGILEKKQSETSQTVEEISQTVSETTKEQNEKISQVTQTVDELNSKIKDIADITITGESNFATVDLDNINQSEPITIKIRPVGENISYLYPNDNLFPSDILYPKVRTLRFTNKTTGEVFDYELPDDLLYYDSENYDEFILEYDSHTVFVNKRVEYNTDGTTYVLDKPTTVEYEFQKIELTDGDYTVNLLGYDNAYIFVRLMAQNIYTTQFATRAEVNSEISQTTEEINLSVDKKLESYSTTTEMNSAIQITASGINQTVSQKVGKNEVVSSINQSAETVKINANKVDVNGVVTAINNNTSTTINGNKITTGSITANQVASDVITANNFSSQNINADRITSGTINGNNVTVTNLSASNITGGTLSADKINGGTISASAINLGSGTFTANTSGTIRATSGSIGGFSLDGSSGLTSSYGTIRPNGNLLLYPNYGSARYVLSSAMTFNAQGGVVIASSSNAGISAPSSNLDLKACSGATAYLACMANSDGSGERSAVNCTNGILKFTSSGYCTYNGSTVFGSSSRATKENIVDLTEKQKDEVYDLIKNIPTKQFDYKKEYGKPFNYGFIIEDIENTKLNDLLHITQAENNKNIKMYSTEDLARLELITIQKLMDKIEILENKIKELESDK